VPSDPAVRWAFRLLLGLVGSPPGTGSDPWERAVPWPCLQAAGLSAAQARALLSSHYLQHGREVRPQQSARRSVIRTRSAILTPRSWLALTPRGVAYAEGLLGGPAATVSRTQERPVWDGKAGELWWDGVLVKRFRHDAANQRLVLDAFAAAQWVHHIDNLFRKQRTMTPKRCLHWTIESLNRGQTDVVRLRFRSDGCGGIRNYLRFSSS
jgi:hypothetical protein